jgi:DNA polymerase
MNRLRQLHELGVDAVWHLRASPGHAEGDRLRVASEPGQSQRTPVAPMDTAGDLGLAGLHRSSAAALSGRPDETWESLEDSVSACSACGLCRSRNRPVFGAGNRAASLMIVSDAPDADEDAAGMPFAAQSGRLLDNMLAAIGLSREQGVYLTNVVKCRPPANRIPQNDEIRQCGDWLRAQIERVSPRVILALGRSAAQGLLAVETPLPDLRGQVHVQSGRSVLVSS